MARRISILGSTGSIGQNTVDLLSRDAGGDYVSVVALTGGENVKLLARQAIDLNAEVAVTANPDRYNELKILLAGTGVEAAAGTPAMLEAAARPTDWVMSSIVGMAGLEPGLVALENTTTLALANKESLVAAGHLVKETATRNTTRILPVDSEHSAIFQALNGENTSRVKRMILTASGGPFRTWTLDQLARATPVQAMAHPNWSMGARISIDSATMFNKAMEVIETKEFFEISPEKIKVIIHPQSIVHSIVEFCDGAMMAHMGSADMRGAIGYALNWPDRQPLPIAPLDLATAGQLSFEPPDEDRFPALRLARDVIGMGGLAGSAFTAAKESTLDGFVAGRIGFLDMARIVAMVLDRMAGAQELAAAPDDLQNVKAADRLARIKTEEAIALKQAS